MKFLALALLLFSNLSLALVCEPINLVTAPNSPFQKIPVYDQDGIGICYAYTAAQLIDYHLISKGAQRRQVHPTWVALNNAIVEEREHISSGITADAIDDVIDAQNCSYDIVNGAIGVWAKTANVTDSEIISVIEKFTPKYKAIYERKKATAALQSTAFEITRNDITIALSEALKEQKDFECSANPTWDKLVPELHALSIMGSPKLFESLIFPACEGRKISLRIPEVKQYVPTEKSDYSLLISDRLKNLKAPVSIAYCSKVLYDKSFVGVQGWKPHHQGANLHPACANHESLIVGQKKVGESCHFLLRNTWGNAFSGWTENRKCLCKHKQTGAFVDDCTPQTHNNGLYTVEACWVDQSSIENNANAITVLGE